MQQEDTKDFLVLAFYRLVPIQDVDQEVLLQKEFVKDKNLTCRLYIAKEGINGQMSAYKEDARAYMEWMHTRPEFKDLVFKIHYWHENVFPRQQIKKKRELVAFGKELDLNNRGKHLSPKEWRTMLDSEKKAVLIDVRNSYEYDIGHFKGAENPECETFKEFDLYTKKLVDRFPDEKPPVMMYCTGGIRCEFYSSLLKDQGFDEVYQLEGGIIDYGIKEGGEHWRGKLFVFDDRMTIPISEQETEKVGICLNCSKTSDDYYNCANMDCNKLFICCKECLSSYQGCCSEKCSGSEKIRPYQHQNPHKPFKKYYHYFCTKDIKSN